MTESRVVVVVSDVKDIAGLKNREVATAEEYLEGRAYSDGAATIINLCRSVGYGSRGYYVSLLADARGQRVFPSVQTVAALAESYSRFRALQEAGAPTIDTAEMTVRRRSLHSAEAEVDGLPAPLVCTAEGSYRIAREDQIAETLVCMGVAADARFQRAGWAVYREFPAPLLRVQLLFEDGTWKITQVASASPAELDEETRAVLIRALSDHRNYLTSPVRPNVRASIAVLVDPDNPFSPSSRETIDRLERVAAAKNVHIARIGLNDLRKLPEYDALFVRSHTGVTQQAFQFALRAQALDMPVVDAPTSTIRCTNKVFLEELLRREGIPTPQTQIVTSRTSWQQLEQLGLPFVLKLPDGDFSAAVHKINSRQEYDGYAVQMFRQSPLLLAQEWLPTEFDWRIGIIGGKLLFAARYYMARGHWQIRSVEKGTEQYGIVEAVARNAAPARIVSLAIRAASLVGDGFYGVDIKDTPSGPVVIEVNDNPNLDTGYEDAADGDRIYEDVVDYFVAEVEKANSGIAAEQKQPHEGLRKPIRAGGTPRRYGLFEVAGVELEYPIVDRDLRIVPLVEPAFKIMAGRATSDVDLGAIAFSNEFADHVFELKTQQPHASMRQIEELLYEGVQRFSAVLRDEFAARLFPTAMHPWFDPRAARLWTHSGLHIYATYARLFNVRTHGWMNVHASHVNLPFGSERETMAMLSASSLLIPYLPAIAASSPMYDGRLQDTVDSRMALLSRIQARIPESCGAIVPEYSATFGDYAKDILEPMYQSLDQFPDTACIRDEFFNTRAAILRFARKAMEVRVLDTQECVKMDVAIAVFVRRGLQYLTKEILQGRLPLPRHSLLVQDLAETIDHGSAALVYAPHMNSSRDQDKRPVRDVLRTIMEGTREQAGDEDLPYLELVDRIIETGSLSERIRTRLQPYHDRPEEEFNAVARHTYSQLMDSLENNKPWDGRWS